MFGVVLGVKKSQQLFGTNSQVGLGKISWAILKSIGFFSALTPCRAGEGVVGGRDVRLKIIFYNLSRYFGLFGITLIFSFVDQKNADPLELFL